MRTVKTETIEVWKAKIIEQEHIKELLEDIKAEIAKIEIPENVKTVDGSFAFCQALEIADLAIDRVVDRHIGGKANE